MFFLKACPKCRGDLAAETSMWRVEADSDVTCIQCGHYLRPEERKGLWSRLMQRPTHLQPAPAYTLLACV
jgi:hypothetical protein